MTNSTQPMKCYLTDLPKDCGCTCHNGPHWLYIDELQFTLNLQILEKGGQLALYGFAIVEATRLADKIHELKKLVHSEDATFELPTGYRERDYEARIKALLEAKRSC